MRAVLFEPAAALVPRVGATAAGADPDRTLIEILRTDGVARQLRLRPVLGPDVSNAILGALAARDVAAIEIGRTAAGELLARSAPIRP